MDAAVRQSLIERTLVDYFRSIGWEIVGDFAAASVQFEDGNPFAQVAVNLSELAKDIDRDFDFIGAAK